MPGRIEIPHLLDTFDQNRALDYLHNSVDLSNIGPATEQFVAAQTQDVQALFAHGTKVEQRIAVSRAPGILSYTLLGIMAVRDQAFIRSVSNAAVSDTAAELHDDLSASIGEHFSTLKAQIRYGCRPYFEIIRHMSDKHTPKHLKSQAVAVGLVDGYLIANRQVAMDRANR